MAGAKPESSSDRQSQIAIRAIAAQSIAAPDATY